jgi:hypothetical protein
VGCLLALFGAFFPRLALFCIWIARPALFDAAIGSAFWAILGIFFLPFTTLMYVLLWTPAGLSGTDWLFVALGVVIDVTSTAGSAYSNRDRLPAGYRMY